MANLRREALKKQSDRPKAARKKRQQTRSLMKILDLLKKT